ncbi:MAG: inorganic pyrophosphatase, partial [Solirubrobacteraceae bacterium]|nr:inorganic pyrophosphatase [Solirubrobacteraceae bacterium]
DKVVCVPEHDPNWNSMEKLEDLPEPLRDEISHFFSIYKQPEGIAVKVDGWFPREQAIDVIHEAQQRRRDGLEGDDAEGDG